MPVIFKILFSDKPSPGKESHTSGGRGGTGDRAVVSHVSVCEGLVVLVHNPHCLKICSQVGAACRTLPVRASLQLKAVARVAGVQKFHNPGLECTPLLGCPHQLAQTCS